ncbi:transposase [Spirosoma sp. BT702]|uniref:Transposase n=1 Tax=Spirosoma profusum TaxID=2771354 RepID=A0A926XXA5_9BACT|nr:transposase [Spirosoma profusum]
MRDHLAQVRKVIETWLKAYNIERTHQALGFMTPVEFKQAGLALLKI